MTDYLSIANKILNIYGILYLTLILVSFKLQMALKLN